MTQMTRRERLLATFRGRRGRPAAVALWRHFPGDDQRPEDLAWATLSWQAQWDWDFIKVSPRAAFAWSIGGCGPVGGRRRGQSGVYAAGDQPAGRLEATRRPKTLTGQRWPASLNVCALSGGRGWPTTSRAVIQTIFSPLAQAKNLAGPERLIVHIRQEPDKCRPALEVITQTTLAFVEAAKETGIAGIYYAIQLANYGLLNEAEYRVR
jgi:uroporphyrinogen decarboxylase